MWFLVLKKTGFHLCICFLIWLFASAVTTDARYAGWIAAFMGVCYLLAAWLRYLKSKGIDYMAKLRRRKKPSVPYYLRSEKKAKTRIGINGNRHEFDDDIETAAEPVDDAVSAKKNHRYTAIAYLIVALALLYWSEASASFFG